MSKDKYHINFQNTKIAFQYKSDRELMRSYRLFRMMSNEMLSKLGIWLSIHLISIPFVSKWFKRNIFNQFICGETFSDVLTISKELGTRGILTVLDYSIESQESKEQIDSATRQFINSIRQKVVNPHLMQISIKITSLFPNHLLTLYSNKLLSIRKNQKPDIGIIIALSKKNQKQWDEGINRVKRICEEAKKYNNGVLIDAEESLIQPAIDHIALSMMLDYNTSTTCSVYNTYQMYLKDSYCLLETSYSFFLTKNIILGAKLVRGAYMKKEALRAKQEHGISPVHNNKQATDKSFDDALSFCLKRLDGISVVIATHNEHSVQLALNILHKNYGKVYHPHVSFSQLYGMGDHLSYNIKKTGATVSKYMPYGKLRQVIKYLARRAQENLSIEGHSSRELELISREVERRHLV